MENNIYNKYIKYKNKYLNLKQKAGAISRNKKRKFEYIFPDTILKNENIYLAHLNENYDLFIRNERIVEHFLKKKIDHILHIKDLINKDKKFIKLLEQIEISYKNILNKNIEEINIILDDKIKEITDIKDNYLNLFNIKVWDDKYKNNIIKLLQLCNRDLIIRNNNNNIKSYYDIKFYDKNIDLHPDDKKKIEIHKIVNFCRINDDDENKEILYPNDNVLIFNGIYVAKPGTIKTKRIRINGEIIGFYINNDKDSIILFEKINDDKEDF